MITLLLFREGIAAKATKYSPRTTLVKPEKMVIRKGFRENG